MKIKSFCLLFWTIEYLEKASVFYLSEALAKLTFILLARHYCFLCIISYEHRSHRLKASVRWGVSKPKTSKTKTSKTKTSKAKASKAKTSKTKTPEYLLDESFVFVFFPTVHLNCQSGMSKKC